MHVRRLYAGLTRVGAVTGFPEAVERLERFSPDRMVAQYEDRRLIHELTARMCLFRARSGGTLERGVYPTLSALGCGARIDAFRARGEVDRPRRSLSPYPCSE
jgi:hypothetical protein